MSVTLSLLSNHPLRKIADFSLMASDIANVLVGVNKDDATAHPDSCAIRFYVLNQMVASLSQKYTENEKLPDWASKVVSMYSEELYTQHSRMVWYTFLVISREWRHLKNLATVSQGAQNSKMYPDSLKSLHPHIHDSQAVSTLDSWLKKVPAIPIQQYCKALTHSFNTGSWSGGYGGKPWGCISQTLLDYVSGKTSAEMFIDTAYTLAHNNGPMFNKGMMYSMYSGEFKKILDIQRGGQLAEALIYGNVNGDATVHAVRDMAFKHKDELGLAEYVDWFAIEALGALQSYPKEKAAQEKKYGKKPVAPKFDTVGGKVVKTVSKFEWYPGQTVDVFERITA